MRPVTPARKRGVAKQSAPPPGRQEHTMFNMHQGAALKTLGTGLALATFCGVTAAPPADAATVTRDSCAPTFTTVVGIPDAVAFLEAAFERTLTTDELDMTVRNFVKLDRNTDQTICLKIAADSPGLVTPVPQAIDNLLPSR